MKNLHALNLAEKETGPMTSRACPLKVLEGQPTTYVPKTRRPTTTDNPKAVARIMRAIVADEVREVFLVFHLNTRHHVNKAEVISIGTLSASLVHPRHVFRDAVIHATHSIILAHNHPSGDPAPSADDLEITRRLEKAGVLLGISVLDHVIVGDARHWSAREEGFIDEKPPARESFKEVTR